jgi:hypothetical protein
MKVFACLVLVVSFVAVKAKTYAEDYHWANAVQENEGAALDCTEPRLNLNMTDGSGSVEWFKPSGMEILSTDRDFLFEDLGNFQRMRLTIYKVNASNSGIYKCKLTLPGSAPPVMLIRGINIHGPKYVAFLDEYEDNVIVAVVATVVFLVPLLGGCGVWKFRFRDEEEEKENMFNMRHEDFDNGRVMMEIPSKTVAASVESPEGRGAYDNAATDTKL